VVYLYSPLISREIQRGKRKNSGFDIYVRMNLEKHSSGFP